MRQKMKIMGDRILLRLDPESKKTVSGVLYKPDDAHDTILRTGEVIGVGPGRWAQERDVRKPVGVELGEGVVFIKFVATSTKTAEAIQPYLDGDEALISVNDVLLVYDRKVSTSFS